MQNEKIVSIVYDCIALVSNVKKESINLEDSLILDLDLDSIEMIDLVIQLEGYGVLLESEHMTTSLNVQQLVNIFAAQYKG